MDSNSPNSSFKMSINFTNIDKDPNSPLRQGFATLKGIMMVRINRSPHHITHFASV